jgi:pimeloyl-ACP methyl ester carboxylesterase
MRTLPRTHYAKSGELNIAYQVVGDGPRDLIYVPGFISNVEMMWENEELAAALRRLASFARLIIFDKRGTGLSDRVAQLPTLEQRMDDVRAVMDAVRSERAALFGHSEGAAMSILFAATYPERTTALITYGGFAKRMRTADYPWAPTLEERLAAARDFEERWDDPDLVDISFYAPSRAGDTRLQEWLTTYFRRSASPKAAADLMLMNTNMDVRTVLPSVRVPALILHAVGDRDAKIEEGRYLAAHIPGARFVELPGGDHLFWAANQDEILGQIEEFVTGVRPARDVDRVLATVLFTDIVEGTRRAAALGDRGWRKLVEAHHAGVRRELAAYRGTEWDTAGDGFYATFDGPARAARCALAIRDAMRALGLQIRAGLHTGECEQIAGKLGGIAAIIGARVRDLAQPEEVLATSTVKELVFGSGLRFVERGSHALKGIPGEWHLYAVS